jgi:hypothetical protein
LVLVELRSRGMMGEEVSGKDTFSALVWEQLHNSVPCWTEFVYFKMQVKGISVYVLLPFLLHCYWWQRHGKPFRCGRQQGDKDEDSIQTIAWLPQSDWNVNDIHSIFNDESTGSCICFWKLAVAVATYVSICIVYRILPSFAF